MPFHSPAGTRLALLPIMQVRVQLRGESTQLPIPYTQQTTGAQLKLGIYRRTGIPPEQQIVVLKRGANGYPKGYVGSRCDMFPADDDALLEQGILPGFCLEVLQKPPGAGELQRCR